MLARVIQGQCCKDRIVKQYLEHSHKINDCPIRLWKTWMVAQVGIKLDYMNPEPKCIYIQLKVFSKRLKVLKFPRIELLCKMRENCVFLKIETTMNLNTLKTITWVNTVGL